MRPLAIATMTLVLAALNPGCIQINVGAPPAAAPTPTPTQEPVPEFGVDFFWNPEYPRVGQEVVFQATVQHRGNRSIDTWYWDWGDGEEGEGSRATHTWERAVIDGYDVALRVIASDGAIVEATHNVFVAGS